MHIATLLLIKGIQQASPQPSSSAQLVHSVYIYIPEVPLSEIIDWSRTQNVTNMMELLEFAFKYPIMNIWKLKATLSQNNLQVSIFLSTCDGSDGHTICFVINLIWNEYSFTCREWNE